MFPFFLSFTRGRDASFASIILIIFFGNQWPVIIMYSSSTCGGLVSVLLGRHFGAAQHIDAGNGLGGHQAVV